MSAARATGLLILTLALPLAGCASATGRPDVAATRATRPEADAQAVTQPYDVVIEHGRIVDGSGNPWFYGDVGVRGDRIATIARPGMLERVTARRRVDATGQVVAPGFIDIQSGGDFLDGDGRSVGKLTQGVTTEIMGEAYTGAPISDLSIADLPVDRPAAIASARRFMGPHGFDRWLQAMESHGISPNIGSFVGASTLREYGMGLRMGAATGAGLDSMRDAMRRAMEDGAFGLGSALIYPPGNYAGTDELIAIARAMSPYGGLYITHMRSEADQVLGAMDEAFRIGREGGVPVEIYHLKAAGVKNWSKMPLMIAKIDSARAAGLDVQANMYPYTAGGTSLAACFPPRFDADGHLRQNLADPAMRAKIREEFAHPTSYWESLCEQATPAGVLLTTLRAPQNQRWSGHRLSEVAAGTGKDWLEALMDLVLTEPQGVGTIYFLMSEDNVRLALRQPWMKIGTDASGPDPDSTRRMVHPRSYGTYPKILGRYVREQGVIPLEDAVRKMSGAVAERLLIGDRGLVRPGMYADIVVFDPATIRDNSTYEQPGQLSTGVREVFVNGVEVVRDGRHTGAKPGRIVRGPGWTGTSAVRAGITGGSREPAVVPAAVPAEVPPAGSAARSPAVATAVVRRQAAPSSVRPLSLEMRVPTAPSVARGQEGSFLAYELHLTNMGVEPLVLHRVEVLDAGASPRTLLIVADSALRESVARPGTPLPAETRLRIVAGGRAVVYLWVPIAAGSVPRTVRNRVVASRGDSRELAALDGPAVAVAHDALVVGPPLRGGPWLAANGPSNESGHRRALITIAGTPTIAQRFAIDWVKLDDRNRTHAGDSLSNGDVVGLVGNTGNSTEPHLHFHIADANSPLGSEGIPYEIDSFQLVGRCQSFTSCDRTSPVVHRAELPIANILVRFP
jgi:N-acyl-D-amino-acid deacylase